jgi:hypothetical protein
LNQNSRKNIGQFVIRVENIEDELTRNVIYLDKLLDQIANGYEINKVCGFE